jgi:hypothetical protein
MEKTPKQKWIFLFLGVGTGGNDFRRGREILKSKFQYKNIAVEPYDRQVLAQRNAGTA